MTNSEMISIMIMLSQNCKNLEFDFINLPNFNGKCLYCFKTNDGKIDFTYNPDTDNDVSRVFNRVLNMAQRELLPGEILDGETRDTIIGMLLDKIQNNIISKAKAMSGDYQNNLTSLHAKFEEVYETLNSDGSLANQNHYNIVDHLGRLYSSITKQNSTASSYYEALNLSTTTNPFVDAILDDKLPNWVGVASTPINDSVNLARSRALTLALVNDDNFIVGVGRNKNLDNVSVVGIANKYGTNDQARTYYFHERSGKAGDTFDLEKFIIEETIRNISNVPPRKFGDKRQVYYNYLARNNHAKDILEGMLIAYGGGDRQNSNIFTDRIILDSVILNLASMSGYNIDGIYKLHHFSKKSMSEMFRHNYALAKSNPNAVNSVKAYVDSIHQAEKETKIRPLKPYENKQILFPIQSIIDNNEAHVSITQPDGSKKIITFSRTQIETFKRTHELLNEYVTDDKIVELMKLQYMEDNYPELLETPVFEEIEHYKAMIDMFEETETKKPPKKRNSGTMIQCINNTTGQKYTIFSKNGQIPIEFLTLHGFDQFNNCDNELILDFYIQDVLNKNQIPDIPPVYARIADYVSFLEETQPNRQDKHKKKHIHHFEDITDSEFIKLMNDIFGKPEEPKKKSQEPNIDYTALTQEGTRLYADHIKNQGDNVPSYLKDNSNYANMSELQRFKHLIARWHEFDINNINTDVFVREYLNTLKQNVNEDNLNAGIIRVLGLPQDKAFILKYIKLLEDEIQQEEQNKSK